MLTSQKDKLAEKDEQFLNELSKTVTFARFGASVNEPTKFVHPEKAVTKFVQAILPHCFISINLSLSIPLLMLILGKSPLIEIS